MAKQGCVKQTSSATSRGDIYGDIYIVYIGFRLFCEIRNKLLLPGSEAGAKAWTGVFMVHAFTVVE